jgi:hypothetical protein
VSLGNGDGSFVPARISNLGLAQDRRFGEPYRDEPRWREPPAYGDHYDDPFWIDDEPEPPRRDESPKQPARDNPWVRATAAGCTAVAWWLRRRTTRVSLLSALGVGLAAGFAVLVGNQFLPEGSGAAASAYDLLSLANTARSGAAFLGG